MIFSLFLNVSKKTAALCGTITICVFSILIVLFLMYDLISGGEYSHYALSYYYKSAAIKQFMDLIYDNYGVIGVLFI